jgi:hypothetical protein
MPIELNDVIVFSAGGIVTYFGRQLFEQRLAISRLHKAAGISEHNKAVSEFRGAFAPAIFKFKITAERHAIEKMLREELIPQGIAIERFRPFVKDKDAYQEAWESYHLSHKREGVSSVDFSDYTMGEEHERFSLFNQKINDILKFAEPT